MTENEKKYLNLYSIEKINSFDSIDQKENFNKGTAKNNYSSIDYYIGIKIGFDKSIAEKEARQLGKTLKKKIKEIQEISNKFNRNRKEGFKDSFRNFYNWFEKQQKECFYCNTKKNDLENIFEKGIITSKKFNGTLHIEKRDSEKGYKADNMVLACALCNNAKSDMISQDDYETYFANSMKEYLSQCKDKANA